MAPARAPERLPVSVALAGGGLAGALFEFGAVAALEGALPGWKAARAQRIVGTSAGAVTGAVLALGIDPWDVAQALLGTRKHPLRFERRDFFGLPFRDPSPVLSGAFSNSGVERFLVRAAAYAKRADRFASLPVPLLVTATDLDAGERTVFGPDGPGLPPVSRAARASSAIPGTFRPVRIADRDYIDGQLVDPIHLDLAVEPDTEAVFAVSPLAPYRRGDSGPRVTSLKAPAVLDQGSRISASIKLMRSQAALERSRPRLRIFLIEPPRERVAVLLRSGFDRISYRAAWELGFETGLRFVAVRSRDLMETVAPFGIGVDVEAAAARAERFGFEPDLRSPGAG